MLSPCPVHIGRSANLILNLFSLMLDAGVPDIALEPDKTVQKVDKHFISDLSLCTCILLGEGQVLSGVQ